MLLGLLGTAALVTIITVPAVLLSKGSKFEIFKRNTTVGDKDLVQFYHTEENEGFCWGLEPVRQVVAEASQALLLQLLGQQLDSLTSQGLQC